LWQGNNLLAELNGSANGNIAEYSYRPGLDNHHAVIVAGTPYFVHRDAIGNVIALTDSSENVKRIYAWGVWGELTGGTDYRPFNNSDRSRFKGALWLGPQIDLYYMRARWYEARSGRFLSEDPLGIAGGLNPYTYAANDPINGRDPTGLLSCKNVIIIIDDVPVACTDELLSIVDSWLMENHGLSLDDAWAVGGYTAYFRNGTTQKYCPRGFSPEECVLIAGGLATLLASKDAQCRSLGSGAADRFRRSPLPIIGTGSFTRWEGLFRGSFIAYAQNSDFYLNSVFGKMIITSVALAEWNMANVIAHEQYHFVRHSAVMSSSHATAQNDEFWAMGDHCGGPRRR
jgi:RHS repeat-associated protein